MSKSTAKKYYLLEKADYFYCVPSRELSTAAQDMLKVGDDAVFKYGSLTGLEGTIRFIASKEKDVLREIERLKKLRKNEQRKNGSFHADKPRPCALKQRELMANLMQVKQEPSKDSQKTKKRKDKKLKADKKAAAEAATENLLKDGSAAVRKDHDAQVLQSDEENNKDACASGSESDIVSLKETSSSSSSSLDLASKDKSGTMQDVNQLKKILDDVSSSDSDALSSRASAAGVDGVVVESGLNNGAGPAEIPSTSGSGNTGALHDSQLCDEDLEHDGEMKDFRQHQVSPLNGVRNGEGPSSNGGKKGEGPSSNGGKKGEGLSSSGGKTGEEQSTSGGKTGEEQSTSKRKKDGRSGSGSGTESSSSISDDSSEEDLLRQVKKLQKKKRKEKKLKNLLRLLQASKKSKKHKRFEVSSDSSSDSDSDSDRKEEKVKRCAAIFPGQNFLWAQGDAGVVKVHGDKDVWIKEDDLNKLLAEAKSPTQFITNAVEKVFTKEALAGSSAMGFPPRGKGRKKMKKSQVLPRIHPDGRDAIIDRAGQLENDRKSWRPRVGIKVLRQAFSSALSAHH